MRASVTVICGLFAAAATAAPIQIGGDDASPTGASSSEVSSGTARAPGSPVAPLEVRVRQPDGSRFTAVAWGDAAMNGLETTDGYTIVQAENGEWRYAADVSSDAALDPTAARPDEDPVPASVAVHERPDPSLAEVVPAPLGAAAPTPSGAPFAPNVGTQHSLVILADFGDIVPKTTAAQWQANFFGPTSSVAHYYDEVSYGQFDLQPVDETSGVVDDGIVGWVDIGIDHPNSGWTGAYAQNATIVKKAIQSADPFVDFAAYDTNPADGLIEARELHVTVIAAGNETSYTGNFEPARACGDSVWGHQYTTSAGLVDRTPTVDGVAVGGGDAPGGRVGSYTMFGERHCDRWEGPGTAHMATMGIMVHELGHDLGWPDLYDTAGFITGGSNGVGIWSVMAGGSWATASFGDPIGSMPPHPDAWSKYAQGWVVPQATTGTVTIDEAATAGADVFRLRPNPNGVDWNFVGRNQKGTGEYFLIENRQRTGYDLGLPNGSCGLLIWHIDETRPGNNFANADETRKLVDLEEADGDRDLDRLLNGGDKGDPWPGTTANTVFGNRTNPNSKLYSGATSGVSVRNISACGASMSARLAAP